MRIFYWYFICFEIILWGGESEYDWFYILGMIVLIFLRF